MLTINGSPAIEIRKRDGSALYAILDPEDYQDARHLSWWMTGGNEEVGRYAGNSRLGYMHRWVATRMGILAPEPDRKIDIDHIDEDRLNNRRSNLRLATRAQNNANSSTRRGTSKLRGVSWAAQADVWQSHIMVDYKSRFLGFYEAEEDAARAYDIAAIEAFGQYANINFPDRVGEAAPARRSRRRRTR